MSETSLRGGTEEEPAMVLAAIRGRALVLRVIVGLAATIPWRTPRTVRGCIRP
jgi:hypothetical protein